jgi:short-subunit dehydrogenase
MSVSQKYALITGATSGIGYELARLFAKDQYNLVIVARSEEELSTKATELRQQGIEVLPIAKDLMRREAPYLVRY